MGRKQKQETKTKIAQSLKNYRLTHDFLTYKDAISCGLILNSKNITNIDILNKCTTLEKIKKHTGVCECCGCEIKPYIRFDGRLSRQKTCSIECRKKSWSSKCKNSQDQLVKDGKHKGWVSRKIISYPERFWIKVLKNNHIEYDKEHPFGKYFLDFYIVKNGKEIDLEIDGKQHLYDDRKIKDDERDTYIKENNVIVYRIPWNSINTDEGKRKMKSKIDEFLKFYNNL